MVAAISVSGNQAIPAGQLAERMTTRLPGILRSGIFRQDPALATHYQIEAMKHAFADRARWLGDADFAPVPVQRALTRRFAPGH